MKIFIYIYNKNGVQVEMRYVNVTAKWTIAVRERVRHGDNKIYEQKLK